MRSELKVLQKEFEKDIWLYLDKSLSQDRMKFWDQKMSEFPELKSFFNETQLTLNLYKEHADDDIIEEKFERLISNVSTSKDNLFAKIFNNNKIDYKPRYEKSWLKIAFGSALAVASIVILLLSNRPNPVKTLSSEMLDWDAEKITNKIEDVGSSLIFIKNKKAKEYFQNKLANDKWTRDVYNINKSIEKLKKEMKEKSL